MNESDDPVGDFDRWRKEYEETNGQRVTHIHFGEDGVRVPVEIYRNTLIQWAEHRERLQQHPTSVTGIGRTSGPAPN